MLASFIRLVTQTSELQGYTVQKLYTALREDISQESLTLAGVWVIGEYGDILVSGGSYEEEELAKEVLLDYHLNHRIRNCNQILT
jgi:AP-1 complex subunit gamma-1